MDCPHAIGEIRYSEWRDSLYQKALSRRIPLLGGIELTFRCNNNCVHCYCNLPASDREEMEREMDTGTVKAIIDSIASNGCLWLFFTGGEPLLRRDFKDIWIHAKKRGILLTLFTNGTLINDEIADFLNEWRPFSVEITLYGATEKTYETVTRVEGSFRRCMDGIDRLVRRKIPLKLKTMVMKENLEEIGMMKEIARDKAISFRFDPLINSRLDMDRSPLSHRLGPDEIINLDVMDEERKKAWDEFFKEAAHKSDTGISDMLYDCGAGGNSFHIDPYGNLMICIMARRERYNLRIGSFEEGWYNFIKEIKGRKVSPGNLCRGCDLYYLCGNCPGWSQVENGDDESPVQYLCDVARKRAALRQIEDREQTTSEIYSVTRVPCPVKLTTGHGQRATGNGIHSRTRKPSLSSECLSSDRRR